MIHPPFTQSAPRGFSCVGLYRPKTAENVGQILRAAYCHSVAQVVIEGGRGGLRHCTNTPAAHRHIPTLMVDDMLAVVPEETQIIAVDLVPGAVPLTAFQHPKRAFYIFGPEDGTLAGRHVDEAHHVVYVPTRGCMNLAACVNVVLYDRFAKNLRANCVRLPKANEVAA